MRRECCRDNAAAPVTHTSPHQCRTCTAATAAAADLPLLPRIDQWGYLDLDPQPIGPRSLHRLATRMMSDQPPRSCCHLLPGPLDPLTPEMSIIDEVEQVQIPGSPLGKIEFAARPSRQRS